MGLYLQLLFLEMHRFIYHSVMLALSIPTVQLVFALWDVGGVMTMIIQSKVSAYRVILAGLIYVSLFLRFLSRKLSFITYILHPQFIFGGNLKQFTCLDRFFSLFSPFKRLFDYVTRKNLNKFNFENLKAIRCWLVSSQTFLCQLIMIIFYWNLRIYSLF